VSTVRNAGLQELQTPPPVVFRSVLKKVGPVLTRMSRYRVVIKGTYSLCGIKMIVLIICLYGLWKIE
jgi:hypothetical protein